MTSHSADFLNGVCSKTYHLTVRHTLDLYSGNNEDYLYTGLEFGIDCDSRIALVGPNGAGKSTLLKLISLDIEPSEGEIRRNPHLRIGRYNQHSEDVLELHKNPLDFMRDLFPEGIVTSEGKRKMDITDWRGKLDITDWR